MRTKIDQIVLVILVAGLIATLPLLATVASQSATPASGTPAATSSVVREVLAASDPAAAPGEVLQLVRYTIAAGAILPIHTHPGDQMATVDSGVLTYHVMADGEVAITRADGTTEVAEPGATVTFQVGDSWVEPEGMVHYAENLTDQPVVLMASSLFAADEAPSQIINLATPAA